MENENKITINIDRPEPTKQEVAGYKNFDGLLNQYKPVPKPFFSQPLFWISTGLVTALVAGFFLYQSYKGGSASKTQAVNPISAPLIKPGDENFVHPDINNPDKNGKMINPWNVNPFPSAIHPPIPGINVPYSYYTIDAVKGGVIKHLGKTEITIPPLAFYNLSGRPVDGGKVTIRYREFHDIIDCFLSGIPMTYDSAGKQYDFQTAGMVDIKAFKDNMPVTMAPGKAITIDMPTTETGSNFSLYKLDSISGKWAYLSRDTSKHGTNVNQFLRPNVPSYNETNYFNLPGVNMVDTMPEKIYDEDEGVDLPPVPRLPRKTANRWGTFKCSYSQKDFPELSCYKGMILFETSNEKTDCSPTQWKKIWMHPRLKKDGDRYYMETPKRVEKINAKSYTIPPCQITVYPVFLSRDYKAAMQKYNEAMQANKEAMARHDDYLKNVSMDKSVRQAKRDSLKRLHKTILLCGYNPQHPEVYRDALNNLTGAERDLAKYVHNQDSVRQYEANLATLSRYNAKHPELFQEGIKNLNKEEKRRVLEMHRQDSIWQNTTSKEINYSNMRTSFSISGFGIYNSDCKQQFTSPVSLKIFLRDKDGKSYDFAKTYLVDKTAKFMHTFYNIPGGERLTMNSGNTNIVFGVMPDNRLAIVKEADMKNAEDKKTAVLPVFISPEKFSTIAEVRNFILGNTTGD